MQSSVGMYFSMEMVPAEGVRSGQRPVVRSAARDLMRYAGVETLPSVYPKHCDNDDKKKQ